MEVGRYLIDENLSLREMFNLQEMNISVGILGLPNRVNTSLVGAGINDFSKLINEPIKDLIKIKSFGVTSLTKIIENSDFFDYISKLSLENQCRSKSDWESFETSWDFKKHPLV